jgi:hypothetical protein
VQAMQQRDEPAERGTEHAVDPALALDVQQDWRILAFASAPGKRRGSPGRQTNVGNLFFVGRGSSLRPPRSDRGACTASLSDCASGAAAAVAVSVAVSGIVRVPSSQTISSPQRRRTASGRLTHSQAG